MYHLFGADFVCSRWFGSHPSLHSAKLDQQHERFASTSARWRTGTTSSSAISICALVEGMCSSTCTVHLKSACISINSCQDFECKFTRGLLRISWSQTFYCLTVRASSAPPRRSRLEDAIIGSFRHDCKKKKEQSVLLQHLSQRVSLDYRVTLLSASIRKIRVDLRLGRLPAWLFLAQISQNTFQQ